jgi:hypothetical protein
MRKHVYEKRPSVVPCDCGDTRSVEWRDLSESGTYRVRCCDKCWKDIWRKHFKHR